MSQRAKRDAGAAAKLHLDEEGYRNPVKVLAAKKRRLTLPQTGGAHEYVGATVTIDIAEEAQETATSPAAAFTAEAAAVPGATVRDRELLASDALNTLRHSPPPPNPQQTQQQPQEKSQQQQQPQVQSPPQQAQVQSPQQQQQPLLPQLQEKPLLVKLRINCTPTGDRPSASQSDSVVQSTPQPPQLLTSNPLQLAKKAIDEVALKAAESARPDSNVNVPREFLAKVLATNTELGERVNILEHQRPEMLATAKMRVRDYADIFIPDVGREGGRLTYPSSSTSSLAELTSSAQKKDEVFQVPSEVQTEFDSACDSVCEWTNLVMHLERKIGSCVIDAHASLINNDNAPMPDAELSQLFAHKYAAWVKLMHAVRRESLARLNILQCKLDVDLHQLGTLRAMEITIGHEQQRNLQRAASGMGARSVSPKQACAAIASQLNHDTANKS